MILHGNSNFDIRYRMVSMLLLGKWMLKCSMVINIWEQQADLSLLHWLIDVGSLLQVQ